MNLFEASEIQETLFGMSAPMTLPISAPVEPTSCGCDCGCASCGNGVATPEEDYANETVSKIDEIILGDLSATAKVEAIRNMLLGN